MCIYCNTANYRKIYENHHGPIPREEDGRTYEIHHKDGNHSNNDPQNLMAVTLLEHYDIHYSQGDYQACRLMAMQRMDKTPEEISKLNRMAQLKLMEEGRHHFVGDTNPSVLAVKNGTHPWQRRPDGTSHAQDQVKNGTHPFMRRPDGTSVASDQVKNGTSAFLGGEMQRRTQRVLVESGKHNLLGSENHKKGSDHPNFNPTIHTFVHESGIVETCTRYELVKKYDLGLTHVIKVIKGKRKSHGGWRLA